MSRNSELGIRNWECRERLQRGLYSHSFRIPLSSASRPWRHSAIRTGLTLIELLITITILATLAAVFLGVTNAAMESSRSARTKSTISKIHSLLMERWDNYSTRRIELNQGLDDAIAGLNPNVRGYVAADARLLATRELMKLEMPDRWSDVNNDPVLLAATPAITRFYRRQLSRISQGASNADVLSNQRAECLYMIVMNFTGDGEARTLFSRKDIGDTDGDGAREFLDGWGRPISFMRWPAGFAGTSYLMTGDADADHDPFDPYRRDLLQESQQLTPDDSAYANLGSLQGYVSNMRNRLRNTGISAYRLIPLIYSVGTDGASGLESRDAEFVTGLDPYESSSSDPLLGLPAGDSAIDNIHNHLLDGS